MQKSFSLILANTSRSYHYFNQVRKAKLFVDKIIYYSKKRSKLIQMIEKYKLKNKILILKNNNINSLSIKKILKECSSEYILFSGYKGEIIKNNFLSKKNIVHCHPGDLPKFKGSTTIYYSLLKNFTINVTLIRIKEGIDSGNILFKKKFNIPKNLKLIEKYFDDYIRADTFVRFIKSKKNRSRKQKKIQDNDYYYIAHPVIRDIVINNSKYN